MSTCINYEDREVWTHLWRVHLSEFDTDGLEVYANCEDDALETACEYAKKQGWDGLFSTQEEVDEVREEDGDAIADEQFQWIDSVGMYLNNAFYLRIVKIR